MKKIIFVLLFINSICFSQQKNDSVIITKEKKLREINSTKKEFKNTANYNLGNTQYKNKKTEAAKINYATNAEKVTDKKEKQNNYHNLGNTYMLEKNYQKAVDAYKNALKNNPTDDETRYNLALAKKMLEKNPQKPKPKKDKNKEKQNKDNNDKKKDEPKKDEPKKQPTGANKQRIDNILNALEKAEKKTQEKVNEKKPKTQNTQKEKDW
jgi:tetratricopeptide (TPR) repeat protein